MRKALFLLVVLTAAMLAGCDDDDVGIQCETPVGGAPQGGSETGGFTIEQSLQCRSRLCITDQQSVNPTPRCTQVCESDGDCPSEGPNCAEGFLCRVGTSLNILGLRCCKLCICKDDLSVQEREEDATAQRCEDLNIEASCPEL